MASQEAVTTIKVLCTLAWLFIASYYFSWGECQSTVTAPIDETGWVPDGAFSRGMDTEEEQVIFIDVEGN